MPFPHQISIQNLKQFLHAVSLSLSLSLSLSTHSPKLKDDEIKSLIFVNPHFLCASHFLEFSVI
ncbi:MAG: hypothetical protein J8272_00840, partial ['Prunus persica' phytoplasma PP2]|nr:hypothetical protein ['Prunus persica' phytoplasma PP2]